MGAISAGWAPEQLAEFLAAVSGSTDESSALVRAVERAAEAFEAEVAFVVLDGEVVASVGFPPAAVPSEDLVLVAASSGDRVELPGVGSCVVMAGAMSREIGGDLLVARRAQERFAPEERNLLRGMARVLVLTLDMLERQALLGRLSRIQRSISHRAPLEEVLDSITVGAGEILRTDLAVLRLIDPDDPEYLLMVSSEGLDAATRQALARTGVEEGVGGRAILQDDVAVIENYAAAPDAMEIFRERRLQAAMAAPVHEGGRVVGSLTVASYRPGRVFRTHERETLRALAEHASLALSDAQTVEAMREAERSRDMFLAMVSHELKTPLTVIMGALRTLERRQGEVSGEMARELISTGYARAQELQRLIDKLLRGARAKLAGVVEEVDLPRALRSAVRGFGRSRRVLLADPPPVVVRMDASALEQVLGVLLENAVAHSIPGAEVRVEAALEGSELTVAVTNPGTLPADLTESDLFSPFRRGGEADTPGVGLGLFIARRIVDGVGGSLRAQSGHGSVTFTLRMPVEVSDRRVPDAAAR